jgi:hypothetical protein
MSTTPNDPTPQPSQLVEIVDDIEDAEPQESGEERGDRSAISEPGKLMRIAIMLREMQEEVRQAPVDEAGRARLRHVHEQALHQMDSVLSRDLREELANLALPFTNGTPSESEIRIAQAQLIGWLEGLFQGIQAAIFNQQLQARQQLQQLRPRGLGRGEEGPSATKQGTGQYL